MIDNISDEVTPKRRGRPPKERPSILTPEQVLGLTPEQIAEAEARERERLRGIARRKEARAEKEVDSIESCEQLWAMNRKLLPEAELSALLEKQERVWDQLHWLESVMDGTYNVDPSDTECYVSIEEGAADLFEIVKANGTVMMEVVLIDQYWKNADLYQRFEGNDPTSIFARTGLVIATPGHKLHQFQQFLSQRATQTTTPLATNGYTTMKCTTCHLLSGVEAVPQSIADRHHELGIKFQCGGCRTIESKTRAQSTLYTAGSSRRGDSHGL
jgi:hypothetical protein